MIENIYFILYKSLLFVKDKINISHLKNFYINLLNDSFIIKNSIVVNTKLLTQKVKSNLNKYINNIYLQ